jgi:N-carbamoylputrescine amidase
LGQVARQAGVALVGGVIQREGPDQPRFNTALCFDAAGHLVSRYRKVHVPQEEGYWEADHYQAGTNAPAVIELAGARVGIQICSDINRLVGAHLLAAGGAEVIVVPRATPSESYARWRKVFEVAAITTASYIVSVNRPRPEFGVDIGGPSIVVAPDGALLLETTEPISTVSLDLGRVEAARAEYPGYLAYPAEVYANGWRAVR